MCDKLNIRKMKRYIYHRVSTNEQDYTQQENCVNNYLINNKIKPTELKKVVEKISGTVNHRDRALSELLQKCEKGDTIYFSELSRLGRNMNDLSNIVNECCERGVILIQCKDGMQIESNTIGGKALLFALSLAAEIEVANIRQRTQMGLDARKKLLKENGYWISNSGKICRHLGNKKGCDLSSAQEQSAINRRSEADKWYNESTAYEWVKQQVLGKVPRNRIIEEFNRLHELQPNVFCTRTGKKLSKGTLSIWVSKISPIGN